MNEPHITYNARPDVTPEAEREILASIYAFVLRTHQERQMSSASSRIENAEGNLDEPGAAPITHDG